MNKHLENLKFIRADYENDQWGQALDAAISALAPPSGEGVDAPDNVADNAGYIEHCAGILERKGYEVTGRVLRAIAAEHRRLATPQSAPVDGDVWLEAYRLAQEADDFPENRDNGFKQLLTLRNFILKHTTPPPASQERDGEPSQADMTRLWRNRWISERTEFYRPTVETYESARARAEGDAAEYEEQFSAAYERITASPTSSASEASINSHEIDSKLIPDAAEQAKPDDCPFCGQPQHYTDEDCPILSRAHTTARQSQGISHATARVMLDSLDDFARMDCGVDAKGPREALERYINQQEASRLAGGVTVDYPMVHLALNAQPYLDKNDAMRVWQLFKDGVDSETAIRAALVAALGAK